MARSVRGFSPSLTPEHVVSIPLHEEIPLKDEDRIVPPVIEDGEEWFAVTVAPRGERAALASLKTAKDGYGEPVSIKSYVPMETYWVESVKLKLKQKRETQRPILPGYVFLRVPPGSGLWYVIKRQHRDGRNVHGIGGVITNEGQPCRIATGILRQLASEETEGWFDERRRKALVTRGNPDLSGPLLRAGESLRIVGGAFASFNGVAEGDSTSDSVRALVDLFGRSTLVVVPLDQVENISRDVPRDPVGAMPISRAEAISGLAQSQTSAPVGWQALEERRIKRVERELREQRNGRRPLKQRA